MARGLRNLLAIAAGLVVLITALGAWVNAQGLSPEELARRCAACKPVWSSYQEDIKAIHSPTVAKWHGVPSAIHWEDGRVAAEFSMEGFWAESEAAIPILLRTPEGQILRNSGAHRTGTVLRYDFEPPPGAQQPPWIALHYPHTERRFSLNSAGAWPPH